MNIVGQTDHVHGAFTTTYTNDGLGRLTSADDGTRDEIWTLTQPGNWSHHAYNSNGDADYLDIGDFEWDGAAYNVANESLDRDVDWGNGTGTPRPARSRRDGTVTPRPARSHRDQHGHATASAGTTRCRGV